MKIIALMPIKNEKWIIENSLHSLDFIVDEIIILDDNSTDDYQEIFRLFPKVKVFNIKQDETLVNMSEKRKKLLELGREYGGTHFVWLDADEVFSDNFCKNGRGIISQLVPGQKLMMKWVFLWKSYKKYRIDGIFSDIFKDFVVCDIPDIGFENKILSEGRTPGPNDNCLKVNPDDGIVAHLQYLGSGRNELKQAWYRCSELIEGKRSARRINNTYSITMENGNESVMNLPEQWSFYFNESNFLLNKENKSWHFEKIIEFFNKYGIEFFESLQIWHIKVLNDEFVKRVGRQPKSKTFPMFLIWLNSLKNKLKNKYL